MYSAFAGTFIVLSIWTRPKRRMVGASLNFRLFLSVLLHFH
jgi:hypothetical protein